MEIEANQINTATAKRPTLTKFLKRDAKQWKFFCDYKRNLDWHQDIVKHTPEVLFHATFLV
jgi:hypothetical protein